MAKTKVIRSSVRTMALTPESMQYGFNSSDIRIFPSSRRSDYFDRNARLNTEQNFVSIVNRLTSRDCFVIDGLTINAAGTHLLAGNCNMHGYLFKIQQEKALPKDILASGNESKYLCLVIKTAVETTVTADAGNVTHEELVVLDSKNMQSLTENFSFDELNTDGVFKGLGFALRDKTATDLMHELDNSGTMAMHFWYLPIAEVVDGK